MRFVRASAKLAPLSLSQTLWSAAFVALVSQSTLASPVTASGSDLTVSSSTVELPPFITPAAFDSHDYGEDTQLAVDTMRPIRIDGQWKLVDDVEWELRKRTVDDSSGSTPSSAIVSVTESSATATATQSSTMTSGESALPSPMDENLNYNFTTNGGKSCPAFLNSLLADEQFTACYPISMLLKGSHSFFSAQRELQSVVSILDTSCDVDFDTCKAYLKQKALDLTGPKNCAEEYRDDASNIMMVYWGLIAYEPLYKATCIRDPETSMYCYANAVTNTSTTGNAYTYFMPLNSSFPATAEPSCNTCLQKTMAVFQSFTNDASQPVAYNYGPAAKIINNACGQGFVNQTSLKITVKNGTVPKANGTRSSDASGRMAPMPAAGTTMSTILLAILMGAAFSWL
ncbi:C6 transcription factor [Ceratocystis lukuohia]|uniref:DUF7729 domain-containing protein n=2 Tax=Ceratocystis TaxID=5157 RepID=A0A0F8DEY8_CERFI|nr:hypothetical protein CFO_g3126 [Ceratocystis platani]